MCQVSAGDRNRGQKVLKLNFSKPDLSDEKHEHFDTTFSTIGRFYKLFAYLIILGIFAACY